MIFSQEMIAGPSPYTTETTAHSISYAMSTSLNLIANTRKHTYICEFSFTHKHKHIPLIFSLSHSQSQTLRHSLWPPSPPPPSFILSIICSRFLFYFLLKYFDYHFFFHSTLNFIVVGILATKIDP